MKKGCTKCKETKAVGEFYRNAASKDGLTSNCKDCHRRYNASAKGKVRAHKYNASEKGKVCARRYWVTDKGKVRSKRQDKVRQLRYPDRIIIRNAVTNAIRAKRIPPAKTLQCSNCPEPAAEYHHFAGYEPEHQLDVIPVCYACHNKLEQLKKTG